MKKLHIVILAALLVSATSSIASAQTCEPRTFDPRNGECSLGAQAPTPDDLITTIRSGAPSAIVSQLEYGEMVECMECIPLLQRAAIDNADPEVRNVAAWWLRRRTFGFGAVMVYMKNMLATDTDPVRRARAAEALGTFRDPHALDALRTAATSDSDARVRASAVRGLGDLNISAGNPIIASAIADSNVEVRRAALSVVITVNFFRQHDALLTALGDTDAGNRRQAALLVGEFRVAAGVGALAALLRGDPSADVRQAAAWALGRIGTAEAFTALGEASRTESNTLVKSAIDIAQLMRR